MQPFLYSNSRTPGNSLLGEQTGIITADDLRDRKSQRVLLQRFLAINEGRLVRTIGFLNVQQQLFLESLPLMLHVNHTLLPGYITNSTPCGISRYEPTKNTIRAAKSFANAFAYTGRTTKSAAIHNVSIMGSCGSIAHARGSDLDFWICHDPTLSAEQLAELEQKLFAIQKWAESLSLEIHFFLMNAEQFRQGLRRGVSGEDCGSSQHFLLLDEFYRTSIRLAGRYPLWWMVPAEQEKTYQSHTRELIDKRFIDSDQFIDFGGIPEFPAGEFVGAGLWQLYKGIDSPYKSVIKIMLTELYASEFPEVEGLSLLFKKMIYAGETGLDVVDPYSLLYKRLEIYLRQRQETARLELLRRCIYLKINEPMSRPNPKQDGLWRRQAILKLMADWQWSNQHVQFLDSRKNWKIQQVISERKLLVDELNFSYRFLVKFAKDNNFSASINQQDMNLLGRKLYAAFERKAGKLEIMNASIAPNITEEQLTLMRDMADPHTQKKSTWILYSGFVRPEQREEQISIRRSRSIVDLIAWCYFNRVLDETTRFVIYPGETVLTEGELKQIVQVLQSVYPLGLGDAEQQDFYEASRIKSMSFFVNIGSDPMKELNRRGMQLLSESNDALNYSGLHTNLVMNVDELVVNSWHEVSAAHYDHQDGLMDFILNFLRHVLRMQVNSLPVIEVLCFCPTRPQAIAERIKGLFRDLMRVFLREVNKENHRYIIEMGGAYYVLQVKESQPSVQRFASIDVLLQNLSQGQSQFSRIMIDSFALKNHWLPILAPHNKANFLQVFYRKTQTGADFYVLDEKGACFVAQELMFQEKPCLQRWLRFLTSTQGKLIHTDTAVSDQPTTPIGFYEMIKREQWVVEPREIDNQYEYARFHQVQVLMEAVGAHEYIYTFYCDHEQFSEQAYGGEVFAAVAQHLMQQRAGTASYPLYITEIDITGFDQRGAPRHTVFYLQQKAFLEQRLNAALRASGNAI